MVDLRDKFAGVVLGTAIGDALGYPVEFMSVEEIGRRFGPAGVTDLVAGHYRQVDGRPHGLPYAQYSDDTQMFRAVCLGLLAGATDLDAAGQRVADEIVAWAFGPENNRAPGTSCMTGAHNLRHGTPWRSAGQPGGGGCGAAMRSQAYGLWWWDDPDEAARWAAEHASMTHGSAMAQASAAAVAAGVAVGVSTSCWADVACAMINAAALYDEAVARMIAQARVDAAIPSMTPARVLDRWRGWRGDEAVAASLYCAVRGSVERADDSRYRAAVLTAVNSPGDSDSLGCITGALVGAVHGGGSIPGEWIGQVERHLELIELTVQLWRGWHRRVGIEQVPVRQGLERPWPDHVARVLDFRARG